MTQLPFVAFYERLVKAIGPLYFEHGHTILEVNKLIVQGSRPALCILL